MIAILTGADGGDAACPTATQGAAARAARETRTRRCITRSSREGRGSGLEEVAELEVQFPAWIGPAVDVDPVEPIGVVDAEGAERRDDGSPDSRAAEQAGRVELRGPGPHVAVGQDKLGGKARGVG